MYIGKPISFCHRFQKEDDPLNELNQINSRNENYELSNFQIDEKQKRQCRSIRKVFLVISRTILHFLSHNAFDYKFELESNTRTEGNSATTNQMEKTNTMRGK
mmetsp:Transcript_7666/g.16136  ORF Transcript_7666/g.16136 Transcript_7666/m.16136 type:complete len:103 (+) Transcript_7666:1400-1708(+)